MTGDRASKILNNKDDYSNCEVREARAYLEGCFHTKKELGEGIIQEQEARIKVLENFAKYVRRNTKNTAYGRNYDSNLDKLFERAEKALKKK